MNRNFLKLSKKIIIYGNAEKQISNFIKKCTSEEIKTLSDCIEKCREVFQNIANDDKNTLLRILHNTITGEGKGIKDVVNHITENLSDKLKGKMNKITYDLKKLDEAIKKGTEKYNDAIKKLNIKQFRQLIFNEGDKYGWGKYFYDPFVEKYNKTMDFFQDAQKKLDEAYEARKSSQLSDEFNLNLTSPILSHRKNKISNKKILKIAKQIYLLSNISLHQ